MRDYVIAGVIVLVALVAVGAYLYARRNPSAKTAPAAAGGRVAPVEHSACDVHRAYIAEKTAEYNATPTWDTLRRDNINGALSIERARLAECERQETRRDSE